MIVLHPTLVLVLHRKTVQRRLSPKMQTTSFTWTDTTGWQPPLTAWPAQANWVLFVDAALRESGAAPVAALRVHFSAAVCTGSGTAGECLGATVRVDSLTVLDVEFDSACVRAASIVVTTASESSAAATELGRRLAAPDLHPVLVLSFCGEKLSASFGSTGGWEPFGRHRLATPSVGNVLCERDGQPALTLYPGFLGDRTAGFAFPRELRRPQAHPGRARRARGRDRSRPTRPGVRHHRLLPLRKNLPAWPATPR